MHPAPPSLTSRPSGRLRATGLLIAAAVTIAGMMLPSGLPAGGSLLPAVDAAAPVASGNSAPPPAVPRLPAVEAGSSAPHVAKAEAWIDANGALLAHMSREVWGFAELGFREKKSAALLAKVLEDAGFKVKRNAAGSETAFVAEFGEGGPVIALCAEYDALPTISQKVLPTKDPVTAGAPGHGCGHNLLGAASVYAGIAVKEALVAGKLPGRIRVYGTPAEEGGAGKVYMVRDGLFKDVDACLTWHPSTDNEIRTGGCLAIKRARFRFTGLAAHAAGSPERGRSALDAVELMNVGSNYLREHLSTDIRIHYVITDGGGRPNVVPEVAEVWYYVRGPTMADAEAAFTRVVEVAKGAAMMTRTEVALRRVAGTYEVNPNMILSGVMLNHLRRVGAPKFDETDAGFARELRKSLGLGGPADGIDAVLATKVGELNSKRMQGSTDVGDVSFVVPTAELRVATFVRGSIGHSWSNVACSGHDLGVKGAMCAAKVMAGASLDLFNDPATLKAAAAEFAAKIKGVNYKPGLPDGDSPPDAVDD